MSNETTSFRYGGFRVEDITFKNARQQSAILSEGVAPETEEKPEVEIPKSMTPEQIKLFLKNSIKVAVKSDEKRVFSQMIEWIDELFEAKRKLRQYELNEMRNKDMEETPDDIQE